MSLLKLINLLGQGLSASHRINKASNNWTSLKDDFRRNMTHQTSNYILNYVSLHERNGSRGNGIGMGHRNQKGWIK